MSESSNVVSAICRTLSTLADGTVRLKIDFEPRDREDAMRMFGEPGSAIAVARLTTEAASSDAASSCNPRGDFYRRLRQSSFLTNPKVWSALGTDEQFLVWVRQQPCAECKREAPSEAAHVRRVSLGSGTGIKPSFSSIPLCHTHHDLQHRSGEGALKTDFMKKRIQCLQSWAWESLRALFGVESMLEVDPGKLIEWAREHGLAGITEI